MHRRVRIGDDRFEQRDEVAHEALGGPAVVEIRGVLEPAGDRVARLPQFHREVEHRRPRVDLELLADDAVEVQVARGRVLEHEHLLEQRGGPSERAGASACTTRSNGASWCAYAPSAAARPLARTSRKLGSPERSARSASVFAKNPSSSAVSGRVRFAIGVPTTTSSCPVYRGEENSIRGEQDHEDRRATAVRDSAQTARRARAPARRRPARRGPTGDAGGAGRRAPRATAAARRARAPSSRRRARSGRRYDRCHTA